MFPGNFVYNILASSIDSILPWSQNDKILII